MHFRQLTPWRRVVLLVLLMLAAALPSLAQGEGEELEPLLTLNHENTVEGATWNHDETQLLTWSWDSTARVWAIPAAGE